MSYVRGRVRPSALAGQWYPRDARVLDQEVHAHLARASAAIAEHLGELASVAFIVTPHAGMMYSGPTAGHAWAAAPRDARRVILVGPAHRVPFRGIALGDFEAFAIPTAQVPVDRAALAELEARFPELCGFVPGAHDEEHCLEIQLPFLHAVLPGVPIVPLLAGAVSTAELATVLSELLRPGDLLAVSTDLSHFHPYDDARRRDSATLEAIVSLATGTLTGEDACGHRGVSAAGTLARKRGYRAVLLDYRSSGDTGGDRDAVVGYGAVAIGAPAPHA